MSENINHFIFEVILSINNGKVEVFSSSGFIFQRCYVVIFIKSQPKTGERSCVRTMVIDLQICIKLVFLILKYEICLCLNLLPNKKELSNPL